MRLHAASSHRSSSALRLSPSPFRLPPFLRHLRVARPLSLSLSLSLYAAALAAQPVLPLWRDGAPGSEARRHEPEKIDGDKVSNIHHPSLTVYLPPADQATGTAVIVIPGGGHRFLVMNHEGYNVAQWLVQRGIAAFILKHRLGKDASAPEGQSPYQWDVHGLADGQRALRLIRSRAAEWKINPARVGLLGFSAGGEIAFLSAMRAAPGNPAASDAIERESARPDFQALIYPGKSALIKPEKGAPPAFLAAGFGDRKDISEGLAEVYLLFKRAGVPAELHLYAGAGHGFGVRESNKSPAGAWPQRFVEWLADQKLLR